MVKENAMQKTRIFLMALLVILSMALLAACTPRTQAQQGAMDKKWNTAKAICFEQAQDMTNSTVSVTNPDTNDYFKSCMRTRFGYTNEQLSNRGYK